MTKLWIVTGSRGEWSDRYDWNIAAYPTKEEAENEVRRLDDIHHVRIKRMQLVGRPDYEIRAYDYERDTYGIDEIELKGEI